MAAPAHDLQQNIAAQDLHVELLPGTEIMVQTEHSHFATGGRNVLVPQPANDPSDPLNWSRKWKFLTIFQQLFFVLSTIIPNLAIAPMTPILSAYFGVTPSRVALYTGAVVITLGYANFILVPLANLIGRRPMTLICSAICIGSTIWLALSKSDGSFIAARAISGIGAAANESYMAMLRTIVPFCVHAAYLKLQVVADLFFLHERGAWMGLYIWTYFTGLFIGPIISGTVAANIDWQTFFWICLAFQCASFIGIVVSHPETRYRRTTTAVAAAPAAQHDGDSESKEKSQAEAIEQLSSTDAAAPSQFVGKGSPSRSQFNLWQGVDPTALKHLWRDFITPVQIFFFPIVWVAAFNLGWPANLLLAVNIEESAAFGAPPYNFTPYQVGLTNLALMIGGFIGLATAGPLSDWLSMRSTRKNGGIREPEMRLPATIPYFIVLVIGTLILAFAWRDGWAWGIPVCIGMGSVGIIVTSIPTIALTYAIDSYKPIAGEILVIGTVAKNTNGFGQTYWIPDPYLVSGDLFTPLMITFALTAGTALLLIPCYIWGKRLRYFTRNSKVHQM